MGFPTHPRPRLLWRLGAACALVLALCSCARHKDVSRASEARSQSAWMASASKPVHPSPTVHILAPDEARPRRHMAELRLEDASAGAGGLARVPVTLLLLNETQATTLEFICTVGSPDGSGGSVGSLRFIPSPALVPPDVNDAATLPGSVQVSWLGCVSPSFSGAVQLGTLCFRVPRDAALGGLYTVRASSIAAVSGAVPIAVRAGTRSIVAVGGGQAARLASAGLAARPATQTNGGKTPSMPSARGVPPSGAALVADGTSTQRAPSAAGVGDTTSGAQTPDGATLPADTEGDSSSPQAPRGTTAPTLLATLGGGGSGHADANVLSAGSATGMPAETVDIPLTLALMDGVQVSYLQFNCTVSPVGDAPDAGIITYLPAAGLPAPYKNDNTTYPGTVAVAWLAAIDPPLSGETTPLGVVRIAIPAGAPGGSQWDVQILNASGFHDGSQVLIGEADGLLEAKLPAVEATVELEGYTGDPGALLTLRFVLTDINEAVLDSRDVQVAFTNSTDTETVVIDDVPADTAHVSCKEIGHFLRRRVDVAGAAPDFTADFTGANKLLGGDFNNDNFVELRDFAQFLRDFGVPDRPASDINGDGDVDNVEFGYIGLHFFQFGDPQ